MKHLLMAVTTMATLTIACGGTEDAATTTTFGEVQTQRLGASSYFAIDEVGLGPDGYVSLTNFTDVPVTLAGLILGREPDYLELPDVAVQPGTTVRIALGDGAGLENVVVRNADIGELQPSDGEIGLYTSRAFDDPTAIIQYLEWGSTPHSATEVAIAAGLWPEGSFAPTADTATRLFRVPESGLWLFEPNK